MTANPSPRVPARRILDRRRWAVALVAPGVLAVLATSGCGGSNQSPSSQTNSNSSSSSSPSSNGANYNEQNQYTINDKVTRIKLDNLAGSVDVVAADGPISVTEKLQYNSGKPATGHDVSGDTLNLRNTGCPNQQPINRQCEVDWEIKAPAGTNLELNNKAGKIRLTGTAGPVNAQTSAGGVEGTNLTSKKVTAKSNAGGVELQFAQAPDSVDASTNAGEVELKLPAGVGYAVDADSNTGSPDVEVQRDPNSPHKIKVKTNAGGIDVTNG